MGHAHKINHVDQFFRCFDIITRLQAGQTMTAYRISELYGLTPRQGWRMLRYIELSLPVYAAVDRPLTLKWMEK